MVTERHPDTDERASRAESDTRDPETLVLTGPRGAANYGYAYHRIADDGTPLCGGGRRTDLNDFETVTIAEAQRRNKSPCGSCERIANLTDNDD